MNMNDYKHVTQRMHPSDACKHEILRAAAQNEQPRETRRQIFWKNLPVAAAGMAACLSLIVGGAFIWQNRADFAPRTQSQVPEVSAVTEEVGASMTTTSTTPAQVAEVQTEIAALTAEAVQTEAAAEVQAVSQMVETSPAASAVTAARVTTGAAARVTTKATTMVAGVQSTTTTTGTTRQSLEDYLADAGNDPDAVIEWFKQGYEPLEIYLNSNNNPNAILALYQLYHKVDDLHKFDENLLQYLNDELPLSDVCDELPTGMTFSEFLASDYMTAIMSGENTAPIQITPTTTVTRPPHDDVAWEYGFIVIPNWLSKEATAAGLLPNGDASLVEYAESRLNGTEYRIDDSLYLTMWMMTYLYAAEEITHEEMLQYVQMVADGVRFSDEFYAYLGSNATMEKVYVGLLNDAGSPETIFGRRMSDAMSELMVLYPEETAAYDLNNPDTLKMALLHNE